MSRGEMERALEALARRQHGVFQRRQVLELGFTARMIQSRRSTGAWFTLAPGVYALPSHSFDWLRQVKAAELSVPGSVVSHRTAAVLHRIPGRRPGAVELSAPLASRHRSRLARVHRTVDVEVIWVNGIRVTPLGRTVVDLAGVLPSPELARVLDGLLLERRLTVEQVMADLARLPPGPGRGTKALGELLTVRSAEGYAPPRNELERVLERLLRHPLLPPADREVSFDWWEGHPLRVDAVLWAWRRIVEVDGRRWHARVADFTRDRARDHLAQRHGFEVTRFSYDQVVGDPGYALSTLVGIGAATNDGGRRLRRAG